MLTVLLAPVPRDEARDEARRELSKEVYRQQQSLWTSFTRWLERWFGEFVSGVDVADPGGQVGALILLAFVVALIAGVLIKFGPVARTRRSQAQDEAAQLQPTVGFGEHRRRADEFAAAGKFAEAVRERLRAIIAHLIDRGILDDRRGRTAAEIAAEAGRTLPGAAGELREAAELFGAIWFGSRPATAASDARMREIDARIAAAKPGAGASAPATAGAWALPTHGEDGARR